MGFLTMRSGSGQGLRDNQEQMITLIMRHTGELFIKTPEAEHPLYKSLILTVEPSSEQSSGVITAMREALLDAVLWFFDLHLEELVDYDYAPEQSKFALNLLRYKLLAEIEAMVADGVTSQLATRNITNFKIIDTA